MIVPIALALALVAAEPAPPPAAASPPAAAGTPGVAAPAAADSFESHLAAGRYADADRIASIQLAAAERAPDRDSLNVAEALERLLRSGSRLSRLGAGEIARARRAVAIRERAHGASDPRVARALAMLATTQWADGHYAEARAAAERALRIFEPTGPEADADRARALTVLANVETDEGDLERGVERWIQIRDLRERINGAESPEFAQALHSLAVAYRNSGRSLEALRTYRQALALRGRVLPPKHPDIAWTLNNLANVYYDLGDYTECARLHRRALAIREHALGAEHAQVALSLMNLGNALERLDDLAGARPLEERALAIYERAYGPWNRNVAQTLNNLALVRMELGDLASARPLLERSIAIRDSLLGLGSAEAARSRVRLGQLHLHANDLGPAERVLREALAAERSRLGPDHPLGQSAALTLAAVCLRLDRVDEALDLALASERVTLRHLRLTAQGLDEAQALIYSATRESGLELALSAAMATPRDSARVARTWDALAHSRSVVLDEMVARRRWAAATADTTSRRLRVRVSASRDRLARLALQGSASDTALAARIATAAAGTRAAERAFAEHSLAFRRELQGAVAGYSEVAAALPPGSALVSFAWYDRLPIGAARDTVPSVAAFVLPPGRATPRIVPLGPSRAVEAAIDSWLESVHHPPDPLRRSRDERACEARGRALRERVWDPIARELADAERVYLVPEGSLTRVPFAALPDARGRALAETGPLLHLLATERDLVAAPDPAPAGHGLLAVGGPAFDARPTTDHKGPRASVDPCALLAGGHFDPLPGAAAEAAEIAQTWDASPAAALDPSTDRARVLTGGAATERALREAAPGRRALHVAAHGFFLPERCPLVAAGDASDPLAQRHPLLRAGLALAGANQRGDARPASDDGILTAEEIAGLDLSSLEWVVLSACETGLGRVDLNEGVLGLRRAFRAAGARALVMSLWRVDDAATSEWMGALYRARFARGRDPAAAVQETTREVLRARRAEGRSTHPYYWAGFVAESGPAGDSNWGR